MQASLLFAVALGGAIGAVARYLVVSGIGHVMASGFPWGTLVVNVLGSVAMGALIELSALIWSPSPALRAFLVVGLLGAFTTFSTFALDVVALSGRGQSWAAIAYVAASVALCVFGLLAAMRAVRWMIGA
jgi:CrcB protein